MSLDSTGPVNIGTNSATSVTINRTGQLTTLNGTSRISGQLQLNPITTYAVTPSTILSSDTLVLGTFVGAQTLNLPAASGVTGKVLVISKNSSTASGVITITPNGGDTINGLASMTLNALYSTVTLISTGSSWIIMNANGPNNTTTGIVLQSLSTTNNGTTTSSGSFTPSGGSITISPTTTASRVMINFTFQGGNDNITQNSDTVYRIFKNGVGVGFTYTCSAQASVGVSEEMASVVRFIEVPGSTSSITYTLQFAINGGGPGLCQNIVATAEEYSS
jgi:hypothetical protein